MRASATSGWDRSCEPEQLGGRMLDDKTHDMGNAAIEHEKSAYRVTAR